MQTVSDLRSVPVVRTLTPSAAGAAEGLELPGQLQAYNEAAIYARVPGYLKSWSQDIGARVKAGQLLAVIDAPELDQQLAQAQAELATIQANLKLAQITSQRFQDLVSDDAVSRQDADEKAFKRITAPFDGVVTERNANIGALVNAGAGSGSASSLFKVADVHLLRVYVQLPQIYSAQVRPGMKASLALPQFPGRVFPAAVVSDAGQVSNDSGTLLVELEVRNDDGALKPGDFAQVRFAMPPAVGVIRVPSSALIFRSRGLEIATVTPDGRAHLHPATVARDLGAQVELSGGVGLRDLVIDTPPDSLEDGDLVRIAPATGGGHARG